MHQVAFDGTLQVPGSVLYVGPFSKQKVSGGIGEQENESRTVRRVEYALLHCIKLDCQNLAQLGFAHEA